MTKVWLVSALVVGSLVAGILLLTHEPELGENGSTAAERPPSPLTDAEVRSYMTVQVGLRRIMAEMASNFGTGGAKAGKAKVETHLRRNHLDAQSWEKLRRRVEYVVDVIRWEQASESRLHEIDREIKKNEGLLEAATSEEMKKKLRETIANVKAQRDAKARPVNDSDRAVAKKYWNDLDKLAPRIR